jgi:alkylation response protein AidB-like acyl-CoA dehydrogenase
MLKLHYADLSKRVHRLAVGILGLSSLAHDSSGQDADWSERYLLSFGESIGGGTSEIQRNIIAERVLGLPR